MATTSGINSQSTIEQIIAAQSQKTEERNTGELGKDDFLKLLVTQVQYQDPLNPSSDTDFIAQMAQFSALEQMQNLNNTFSQSFGYGMIGKYVSAQVTNSDTGISELVTGKVDSVRINSGKLYAIIGEKEIELDDIYEVVNSESGAGAKVSDYSSIIGMLGKTLIENSAGKTFSVEGIIGSVEKKDNEIYAFLDEVDVVPYNLDLGEYEDVEAYVNAQSGKTVTLRVRDSATGETYNIQGKLRSGYQDDSGANHLLLDSVQIPVDSIYATERVDLLSTEQLLLNQILKELQKLNVVPEDGAEEETEVPV